MAKVTETKGPIGVVEELIVPPAPPDLAPILAAQQQQAEALTQLGGVLVAQQQQNEAMSARMTALEERQTALLEAVRALGNIVGVIAQQRRL